MCKKLFGGALLLFGSIGIAMALLMWLSYATLTNPSLYVSAVDESQLTELAPDIATDLLVQNMVEQYGLVGIDQQELMQVVTPIAEQLDWSELLGELVEQNATNIVAWIDGHKADLLIFIPASDVQQKLQEIDSLEAQELANYLSNVPDELLILNIWDSDPISGGISDALRQVPNAVVAAKWFVLLNLLASLVLVVLAILLIASSLWGRVKAVGLLALIMSVPLLLVALLSRWMGDTVAGNFVIKSSSSELLSSLTEPVRDILSYIVVAMTSRVIILGAVLLLLGLVMMVGASYARRRKNARANLDT